MIKKVLLAIVCSLLLALFVNKFGPDAGISGASDLGSSEIEVVGAHRIYYGVKIVNFKMGKKECLLADTSRGAALNCWDIS